MNVAINTPRCHDIAFATDNFGARADDDVHARLGVGVARFANGYNAPAFETNIGLHNAPVVQNQGVGHHAIHRAPGLRTRTGAVARSLALCHAVAYGFTAAKLHFFTVATGTQGVVLFYFNDQAGIG